MVGKALERMGKSGPCCVYVKGNTGWFYQHELLRSRNNKRRMAAGAKQMSSKPEVDNSWHEYGELPPVGVPVELWVGGSFAYNCEFITRRGHHYVMWNLDADIPDTSDYMNSEFRPLRTEREKAIDDACAAVCKAGP